MKFKLLLNAIAAGSVLIISALQLTSCKEDRPEPKAVVIDGFSPTTGLAQSDGASATMVTITGSNFSEVASSNEVKFNGTKASVSSASATELTTSVPSGASTGKITVTVNGQTGTSVADFVVLNAPTITSFTPTSGIAPVDIVTGTVVTLTGTNFDLIATNNQVWFNNTLAVVSAATATQLTVTVPAGATTGVIAVKVNGVNITSATDFIVTNPAISEWSPVSAGWGAEVTITGTGFSTTKANNIVKFTNESNGALSRFATVISATATEIVVKVPIGAGTGKFFIASEDRPALTSDDFVVATPWTRIADYPGDAISSVGFSFSINGKGYVGASGAANGSLPSKAFFEYDPLNNAWTQKQDFAGTARVDAAGFVINGKGYMGTGEGGQAIFKDFWEYDPINNAWTQKKDFGGGLRSGATGFSIGQKGYMGMGVNSLAGGAERHTKDFWEYDVEANTWTAIADLPSTARAHAYGFSIDTKGYVGGGANVDGLISDDQINLWEYTPANGWIRKADSPISAGGEGQVAFVINAKAYIGSSFFYAYDPIADKWTEKATPGGFFRGAGFAIGNYGYAGLGLGGLKRFSKYTPE
jgi:N-acetylneuraminic acid mutarotase